LTIFTAERGLIRAVAKGARKPGAKVAGRADLLNVNSLLMATGKTLDIITQADTLETFPRLRDDLSRLTFGLYYAELTQQFGPGLTDESGDYLEYLRQALRVLADPSQDPVAACLGFELGLLTMVGYKPELTYCVLCREILTDYKLGAFHHEWGGVVCKNCIDDARAQSVAEPTWQWQAESAGARDATHITPLVWRHLILAATGDSSGSRSKQPLNAAHRLMQSYIEHRAGCRMKSLDLVKDMRQQ
jgi:DNA repair protein RecO (recombination protein O)